MFSDLESLWDSKNASHLDDGSLSGELSELKKAETTARVKRRAAKIANVRIDMMVEERATTCRKHRECPNRSDADYGLFQDEQGFTCWPVS